MKMWEIQTVELEPATCTSLIHVYLHIGDPNMIYRMRVLCVGFLYQISSPGPIGGTLGWFQITVCQIIVNMNLTPQCKIHPVVVLEKISTHEPRAIWEWSTPAVCILKDFCFRALAAFDDLTIDSMVYLILPSLFCYILCISALHLSLLSSYSSEWCTVPSHYTCQW